MRVLEGSLDQVSDSVTASTNRRPRSHLAGKAGPLLVLGGVIERDTSLQCHAATSRAVPVTSYCCRVKSLV
ncbi:hypothetical protein J6590_076134 [Homalodisca vitripennis]|nr:hypothetical protein J6590_076134 [Homalodisca vitripennis]